MKRLPKKGAECLLIDGHRRIPVKVMRIYSNGNFASTVGVVEMPVTLTSKAWEVKKDNHE